MKRGCDFKLLLIEIHIFTYVYFIIYTADSVIHISSGPCNLYILYIYTPYILEQEMATHSSILAWRIPWTEEPGGLQSMELHRVRHN